jgi:hypothetical protein
LNSDVGGLYLHLPELASARRFLRLDNDIKDVAIMSASALSWEKWQYLRKLTRLTPPVGATTGGVVAREDNVQTGTSRVRAVEEARQGASVISDDDHHDADQSGIVPAISADNDNDHNDNDQDADLSTPNVDLAMVPPSPLPNPRANPTEIDLDSAGSHQQRGGAAIGPAQPPVAGPAGFPLLTSTIFQTMAAYGPAATDGAAAAFSLATARLSHAPLDAKVTGTFSGVLWAFAAAWQEHRNKPRSYVVSGANILGGAAGVLSVGATFALGDDTKKVAYASAASWAANGFANLMRAGARTGGGAAVDVWLAASGLANLGAALLSATEASAAANDESTKATNLGTISAVFWLAGAVTAAAAVYAAGLGNRGMPPLPDLEEGADVVELPTRIQAPMTE